MKTIYIFLIVIVSSCQGSEKAQTETSPIKIDKRYYNSLSQNDTIVFSNPEFGNDTLIIDSLTENSSYDHGCLPDMESLNVYGRYICGSNVRNENSYIKHDLEISNDFNFTVYHSQKLRGNSQSHFFSFGELFDGLELDESETLPNDIVIPNFTYDAVICGDTLYTYPSEFHINLVLWSYKCGPVGFVTLGNHIWARQK